MDYYPDSCGEACDELGPCKWQNTPVATKQTLSARAGDLRLDWRLNFAGERTAEQSERAPAQTRATTACSPSATWSCEDVALEHLPSLSSHTPTLLALSCPSFSPLVFANSQECCHRCCSQVY